jgi:hypothetical protein
MKEKLIALKYEQKEVLAESYLILGNIFHNQGAFTRAIEEFLIALRYFQESKNLKGLKRTKTTR